MTTNSPTWEPVLTKHIDANPATSSKSGLLTYLPPSVITYATVLQGFLVALQQWSPITSYNLDVTQHEYLLLHVNIDCIQLENASTASFEQLNKSAELALRDIQNVLSECPVFRPTMQPKNCHVFTGVWTSDPGNCKQAHNQLSYATFCIEHT
jgi:hypothetical protein